MATSPVTIDGPVRVTPYHPAAPPPPPAPKTPRAKRAARVKIPAVPKVKAPPAPPSSGVAKPSAPPPGFIAVAGHIRAVPKPPVTAKPAAPTAAPTAAAAPAFPSYGDPVLDARRNALSAMTDTAVTAAQKDAATGTQNLGMLAQLAGMGRVQTEGTTLPPAFAALGGIQTQDAQQALLSRNALAVDSANRVPAYLRAQGLTNLAGFDASVRDAQLKARADQLDFLGKIYQQAILAGNAQAADATKNAIAQLQAQTSTQNAQTAAGATVTAAQTRAAAAGKTKAAGSGAAAAKAYSTRKNQWAGKAHWDPQSESFGGGMQTDLTPGSKTYGQQIPKQGEDPIAFMGRAVQGGVKPMDAVRIALAAGAPLFAQPAGAGHILGFLRDHLGLKRSAVAYRILVKEAHLTPTTGYMIQGPPAP